ncbi:hypothetical protein LTR78_008348 [Recurvomyces mirabilis]|uniref:DUF300-domain-containing protein n=1 Tax=Recurvomyces mirabilis TaxID=574656 RepID=A0AAE0WFS6_9PEZI|nr:hypothetical protein LTR78_008348 [Recurvomyces mirabilis]KAK5158524.1 hypothetical protein LTS14_003544 [Recurvomyces mirabilis]
MVHVNSTCPVPAGSLEYGVRGTAWKPLLWAAAGCTVATMAIAISLITLHLRRYRAPKEQRQIIRIVFSVVVYAVFAFFEVYSYEAAQYIDPLGDLYEAFGLCALYLLFVQYAAPSGTFNDELFEAVRAAEEKTSTFDWPRISWIFVFQYPICEIACVAIILSTEATDHYCVNSLYPWFAHLWVEILQSIGIGACVLSIFKFRNAMKQRMKVRRALSKLGCFKIIVFIRFMQAWVFSLLLQYNVVKTSSSFSYNDILWGIPGLATCAEMVLFSLGFWYAFSSTEYGSSAKPRDTPLPFGRAILDVLNPLDLIIGIAKIFPLSRDLHRSGGWKAYREAQKQAGISGAVRKGVKKYRIRKSSGPGRYKELNESVEELQKPAGSHHQRSVSEATDASETSYLAPSGLSGEQMYQPPSGSPPSDASGHLMAGQYDGRSRSPSQGQWNGQRYNRSTSPNGRFAEAIQGQNMV